MLRASMIFPLAIFCRPATESWKLIRHENGASQMIKASSSMCAALRPPDSKSGNLTGVFMLTDEEIMDIRNRAKLNDNRQINPMLFARDIERAALAKAMPIPKQEPVENPHEWIIEKLSYHKYEREDLSIDDCLKYLDSEWRQVFGRTTRQLVMQILYLLLSPQPAQAAAIPDDWREIIEAVAHIGIDFGYGKYEPEQDKIDKARALLSASPSSQQSNK